MAAIFSNKILLLASVLIFLLKQSIKNFLTKSHLITMNDENTIFQSKNYTIKYWVGNVIITI